MVVVVRVREQTWLMMLIESVEDENEVAFFFPPAKNDHKKFCGAFVKKKGLESSPK